MQQCKQGLGRQGSGGGVPHGQAQERSQGASALSSGIANSRDADELTGLL